MTVALSRREPIHALTDCGSFYLSEGGGRRVNRGVSAVVDRNYIFAMTLRGCPRGITRTRPPSSLLVKGKPLVFKLRSRIIAHRKYALVFMQGRLWSVNDRCFDKKKAIQGAVKSCRTCLRFLIKYSLPVLWRKISQPEILYILTPIVNDKM